MKRIGVSGGTVEFSERGTGDPLLFVHAGVFGDWFAPVQVDPSLDAFRLISVRRAGYVEGAPPTRHLTLADHAAHCAAVLDELEIGAAHFCGHSSSALIGLQLALDRPDVVHSLILLEPAPGGALNGPTSSAVAPGAVGAAMTAYADGRVADGFDLFMRAVGGDHYREILSAALGSEGLARAIRASAYFPDEAAAVWEWAFGLDEAARVTVPMLVVEGERTADVAVIPPESVGLLAALVPHAETMVLQGVSHLMPLEDPRVVAELIAGFAQRNPIPSGPRGHDGRGVS